MPPPPSNEKLDEIAQLLFQRRKIEAIKVYRDATGLGLKQSKDAVDAIEADLRAKHPEKFAPARGAGCLGRAAMLCVVAGAGAGLFWFSAR